MQGTMTVKNFKNKATLKNLGKLKWSAVFWKIICQGADPLLIIRHWSAKRALKLPGLQKKVTGVALK